MADQINVGEAILKIQLDVSNLQKGIANAKKSTDDFAKDAKTSIMGYVFSWQTAALAVGAFVVKSVMDYSKLDKAISNVVASAKRYGIATDNLRGKVENYLDVMESTTRFQDNELADSLNEILGKTRDLGQAMYLNSLAADLSVRRNIPLAASAEMLSNLYAGNTRGLMMVAKELGVTGKNAESASFLFNKLVAEMKGAATEEDNQAFSIKKMMTAFDNLGETLGKNVSPIVKRLADEMAQLLKATNKLFGGEQETQADRYKERLKDMTIQLSKLNHLLTYSGLSDERRAEEENRKKALENEIALTKLLMKQKDTGNESELAGIKAVMAANDKKSGANAEADKEAVRIRKRIEEGLENEQAEVEELENKYRQMGAAMAGVVSNEMEKFFQTVIDGNASLAESFEALGKAMAKGILDAIATMLDGWAAEAYGQAIISLISEDYAGAAAAAAGGAALSASAAGVRAIGNNLKDGAFVTGGQVDRDTVPANIRKNEAVVPLDDPRAVNAMTEALSRSGAGGKSGGNTYQIGSVTLQSGTRAQAKSAAYMLSEEIDKVELRKGRRGRRSQG